MDASPLNPAPAAPTVPPPDFPTTVPPDYVPPPTVSEGPLGSLRAFVQGTIDPFLGTVREGASDLVKSAIPMLETPAIKAGQGVTGRGLLSGAVDMLNPLPRDTSDLLRDATFLAIPGSGGARAAMRVGAGTAGAVAGANLGGTSELVAGGTAIPGLLLGEGTRSMTGKIGRTKRQSAEDMERWVVPAMNKAEPDLKLSPDAEGLYQKAFAPGGIKDIATTRYKSMLDTVENGLLDPDRILLQLPDGAPATFREAMDYIMKGSTAGARKGPLDAAPPSARQAAMDTIKTREAVIEALQQSPNTQEQALGQVVRDETKRMFIDMTARRILRSPGVLNKDTGLWNMRAAQEAFHKELAKNMIPADVYAAFQAAFYRGSKPPQMDSPGGGNPLVKGLYGMGGAMAGSKTGHPIIGYHSGVEVGKRMSPTRYVGETVGEGPLAKMIGAPISLGTAQALKELLSGLE